MIDIDLKFKFLGWMLLIVGLSIVYGNGVGGMCVVSGVGILLYVYLTKLEVKEPLEKSPPPPPTSPPPPPPERDKL